MRYVILLFMLTTSTSAQNRALDRARAALAAGDSSRAHALVRDEARRGTDNAEVWRLRLQLELAGQGLVGVPRSFRHQQFVDDARAILRRAPQDTFALRVLTRDAVWNVLTYDDRRSPVVFQNPGLAEPSRNSRIGANDVTQSLVVGMDEETFRRAQTVSDFDIERREELAPSTYLSGRAESAMARALEYLETWLAADLGSPSAYAEALRLAVTAQSWDGALILARAFQASSLDPRADLYAGLAHYRLGDAETAERVFERALARMTPAARTRFEAIDVLLRTEDQTAYAADPQGVTELFWAQTDPRLLTPVHERRVEHRARVVEADLLFSILSQDLFTITPPRGAETIQGQVWIRYGRPVRAASYSGLGPGTVAVWEYPTFRYVFDDQWRNGEFALYSPGASDATGRDDYVIQDRVLRRESPQQTQFGAQDLIGVPTLVSRFRAADGGTEVVVAFGVPADLPGPVETGVFAIGLKGVLQRVVETRQTLNAGRVVGGLWSDAATVAVRGGERIQVELELSEGTVRGRVLEEVAPLLRSGGLAVSDLLLATSIDDDGNGPVVRDGIGIVPAARAVFAAADPIYVYLEAYGLGLDAGRSRYTVEATLTPEARRGGLVGRIFGRGQGPGVSVRTEAEGSRSTDSVSFFVDVRDQEPGAYTLRVEVADTVTGQTAAAERRVVLE